MLEFNIINGQFCLTQNGKIVFQGTLDDCRDILDMQDNTRL